MKNPENRLSPKIQKAIQTLSEKHSNQVLNLSSTEMFRELNPDVDKEAFSEIRKNYEQQLDLINAHYATDGDLVDAEQLDQALRDLNKSAETNFPNPTQHGIKAILRNLIRRILRFGFADEIERMERFISASTRSINEINHRLRLFAAQQRDLNAWIALYGQSIVPMVDEKIHRCHQMPHNLISEMAQFLTDRMDILHEGLDRRQTEVLTWLHNTNDLFKKLEQEMVRGLALQHRKIESLLQPDRSPSSPESIPPPEHSMGSDYAYYLFETKGRGPEEQIRESQSPYIGYFTGHEPVLDIGCGRGEFLELLREHGIAASGIDSNRDMVEICAQKKLAVVHADALTILNATPDNSIGGLFAGQVVEHLPVSQFQQCLQQAHRVLRPGGVLVYETINTASPFALLNYYFRDPTHQTILHPETYRFLTETTGFADVQLQYRSPAAHIPELPPMPPDIPPSLHATLSSIMEIVTHMHHFIFAPSDIAIIGKKPAPDGHAEMVNGE